MIHVTGKIPRRVAVAVSGGIDSMAALDFLRRSHKVVVLHYNQILHVKYLSLVQYLYNQNYLLYQQYLYYVGYY